MSNRHLLRLLLAVVGATFCCDGEAPARPQWKVFLATDASVPQFGDQVLVDVLDANGAGTASQRLLDGSQASRWPLSFGLLPTTGAARIRVRFFRSAITGPDGLPGSPAMIDASATLPPLGQGVTNVALVLSMACFGVPAQPDAMTTCDPATGEPGPEPRLPYLGDASSLPAPGSWAEATPGVCPVMAPSGMVCVPGGAFLLGSPHFPPQGGDIDPLPERVAVVSSFALDADEFTVGQYRELVKTKGLQEPFGRGVAGSPTELCQYLGKTDSSADDAPVNCLPWVAASAACAALGKRLPTEAEWEYAGGNLQKETPYPWGLDTNFCTHAVIARGQPPKGDPTECLVQGMTTLASGPVAGGMPQDVTELGLLNLAGNQAEWVADPFNAYSSPCWALVDPLCTTSDGTHGHSVRGGSWRSPRAIAAVFVRNASLADEASADTGFRCALSL